MGPDKKRRRESDVVADSLSASIVLNSDQIAGTDPSPPHKKQQQRRSIFVRSLPPTATTESLISHFSESFPIKHATAVTDPTTKLCKGYGFVTFADAEDAQKALQEFNGSLFEGRRLKIEVAEPRHRDVDDTIPGAVAAGEAKPRSVPSAAAQEAKAKRQEEKEEAFRPPKLIIRNLPWSIKKPEQLADLFRSYGKVKHATIPSKKPGLQAGFGFVVLRGKKNAEMALAGVNGKEVDGRTLAVDWAVEKEVWQGQTKQDGGEAHDESDGTNEGDLLLVDGDSGDRNAEHDDTDEESMDEGAEGKDFADEELEADDKEVELRRQNSSSSTLFVRNLPFTSSDETLQEHFSQFGPIRYARIVLDPNTERPKGTGFVCLFNPEDALQCLKEAPRSTHGDVSRSKNQSGSGATPTHSILQNEADDPSGKYTMEGRVIQVSMAVDKSEAVRLTEQGVAYRGDRDKDRRRLYLLSEGTISSKSPLYELLSPSEIAMREASAKQRKTLIQSNPSLHLSLTRLSIRNIPRSITSKDLKALAREAVVGFAKDVKEEKRQRLSKEELARGGDAMVEAEKMRKKRGVGIVKQAKVVFEGREGSKVTEDSGAGRSRGYGFIEYYSHRSALMGLRWMNGHAIEYQAKETGKRKLGREEMQERKKRLIVEFAIENAQVVNRRSDREIKAKEKPRDDGRARPNKANGAVSSLFTTEKELNSPAAKAFEGKLRGKKVSASGLVKTVIGADAAATNTNDKQAKRTRIIARKRTMRREKRKAA